MFPPLIVQMLGVELDSATARFEEAVAVTATATSRTFNAGVAGKSAMVIFWLTFDTAKVCDTAGAAAKAPLPDWLASMLQFPAPNNVTLVPVTVQMLVVAELKVTAKLEEAVAVSVTSTAFTARIERAGGNKRFVALGRHHVARVGNLPHASAAPPGMK